MKIEPWRPKEELVLAPTLYDYLYRAGFTTAEVDWVAITKAPTITWSFPEIPDVEGAVEKEMIAQSIISSEEVRTFMKSSPPWRDEQWTRAAIHILVNHRPNLLLFHLLNPDAVNHTAGPGSWSSSTAYALADFHLRMLLDAVDEAGLRPRTTFFVISDHGFKKAAKVVRLNSFLRQHGHITGTGATMTCDAYALGGGGSAIVYITDRQDHTAVRTSLLEELRGLEGVARVFEPDAFPALGLPPPAPEGRMGDLFVTAAEGYAFASGDDSPIVTPVWEGAYPGHHGYLNTDPELLSNFIASGAGISPGKKIGVIRAVDFAPTVARLFNLLMPAVEGRVVEEIFDGAP